jgi:hypothetical protein
MKAAKHNFLFHGYFEKKAKASEAKKAALEKLRNRDLENEGKL